jgi:hypothetical protein
MHNPEFYERQRMRASTYNIPRFLHGCRRPSTAVSCRGMLIRHLPRRGKPEAA